jgi:hypothetical protein
MLKVAILIANYSYANQMPSLTAGLRSALPRSVARGAGSGNKILKIFAAGNQKSCYIDLSLIEALL